MKKIIIIKKCISQFLEKIALHNFRKKPNNTGSITASLIFHKNKSFINTHKNTKKITEARIIRLVNQIQ